MCVCYMNISCVNQIPNFWIDVLKHL